MQYLWNNMSMCVKRLTPFHPCYTLVGILHTVRQLCCSSPQSWHSHRRGVSLKQHCNGTSGSALRHDCIIANAHLSRLMVSSRQMRCCTQSAAMHTLAHHPRQPLMASCQSSLCFKKHMGALLFRLCHIAMI